ncbi:MAG: Fe-S oxidoreductase [Microbacterium sp.]
MSGVRIRVTPAPTPAAWRAIGALKVERGRALDARIPSVLLDVPFGLIGHHIATAFGWLWGTLWSRDEVERSHGLWVFRGMPKWTFGRGGVCVGSCFLTGDAAPSDAVLTHEAVHAEQWRHYGLLMPVLYLLAGRDPLLNRFEIEAGLEDGGYVRR